ncbi:chromate transporter [Paenibacillus sp. SYP-B3998]|uniref:Chromate transporter n=1 Tax=Paenibacillus sp. SYP-B3998 TaxID=2678564 RepID=A0A6G3ZW53_9BACL|nr:chromate transporter [Paenibacillus sp. SYP-B3998]NEW06345.1 chromate transporter [Paenibacillus sp. SYP-B3998]
MQITNLKKLCDIFWVFLRISPVTFGGGYAMIPAIEREVVEKKDWMNDEEMSELLSIAGAAPGGIGVNASALVGYHIAGIVGAIVAVIGITLPTFLIVLMLSVLYSFVEHYPKMQATLEGIHAAIVGLIIAAGYKMAKSSITDKMTLIAAIGTVIVLLFVPIHPILVIIMGLFLGLIVVYLKDRWGMRSPLHKEKAKTAISYKYADYFIADGI